ncbi:MAG: tetratricopeptide repeat protein [Bacteroidia bacterium]|nr:tetratricopeptide repeat protein [Bacteroidia bacterium]
MKSMKKSTTKVIAFYLLTVLFMVSEGCIQRGKENKEEAKSMPQDSIRTEAVASPVQAVNSEPKEEKTNEGPGALTFFTTGNMIYQYMDDDSSLNAALECYSEAIKIDPEFKEAYFNRGLVKHDLKNYKGAIADFTKAIELDPYDTAAYCFRGMSKNKLKTYNEAITDFNRALELNPNFEEAYFNRGIALIKLGKKEDGCLDLKKALELGSDEASEMIDKYCKQNMIIK